MFPLVHYFVNSQIRADASPLMALGGIFPDIAAAAGMSRDAAHSTGGAFHAWCRKFMPEALPLAEGIAAHGIEPRGVDYYADEHWPGYKKGWCFREGEKYLDEVAAATRLPENLVWWKSHNFIEMGCELIVDRDHPKIKETLLAVLDDAEAIRAASAYLAAYSGLPADKFAAIFAKVPFIFAIADISAEQLAEKQHRAFAARHGVTAADRPAMAALINRISRELEPLYYPFLAEVINKTTCALGGLTHTVYDRRIL